MMVSHRFYDTHTVPSFKPRKKKQCKVRDSFSTLDIRHSSGLICLLTLPCSYYNFAFQMYHQLAEETRARTSTAFIEACGVKMTIIEPLGVFRQRCRNSIEIRSNSITVETRKNHLNRKFLKDDRI